MQFASVADLKDRLSVYLANARKKKEPIVVTHHGKPYALIQPISERDLEGLGWKELAEDRLRQAWEGEDDALYEYLEARAGGGPKRPLLGSLRSEATAGARHQH